MTIQEFSRIRKQLIDDLAQGMRAAADEMGDDVRRVDWISMLPDIQAFSQGA